MEEEHKQNQERLEFKQNQIILTNAQPQGNRKLNPRAWSRSTDWSVFQRALQKFTHCISYYFKFFYVLLKHLLL